MDRYEREYENRQRGTPRKRLNHLRHKAKSRGIEISLSLEEFQELVDKRAFCYYCGRKLNEKSGNALDGFTIDRLDSKVGYTKENTVPCCRRCNIIKGNWFTSEQMLEIANNYLDLED